MGSSLRFVICGLDESQINTDGSYESYLLPPPSSPFLQKKDVNMEVFSVCFIAWFAAVQSHWTQEFLKASSIPVC